MGSSTAYGVGASTYANSWAGKIDSFYNQNTTDGLDTVFYNISFPAYDTYQEMPDDFVPPPGRPLPDQEYNVTKALSFNPDIVLISLPSNDINYGYSKHEMISNLKLMYSTILATGSTICYITTPQPRNDLDQSHRDSLLSMVDSVNFAFGPFAVNFWDGLVTTDGLSMLRDEYRSPSSPVHLNDSGHYLLFEKLIDKSIFGLAGPVALRLTNFKAQIQHSSVLLHWHTEQQGPHTNFELQKSSDAHSFETVFTQNITEARQSSDYSAIDQTPFTGINFYRLRISETRGQSYSDIINITAPGKMLDISQLYIDHGASGLTVEINIQKSQFANIIIINSAGAVMLKQKEFITQPGKVLTIPIGKLASGQYYIRLITEDGNSTTKSFKK